MRLVACAVLLVVTVPTIAGTVTARLQLPNDVAAPESVAVRIEAKGKPATVVECPVRVKVMACAVPEGTLDLRIAPAGVAPRYVWSVDVLETAIADLGELRFQRGGSMAGFVRFDGDAPPLHDVVVEIVAPGHAQKTRANARGFFQLAPLEAGEYTVIARHAGWSAARVAEVVVEAGRETVLARPLTIEPLARVEVLLQPMLDPYGEPWKVALRRLAPVATMSTPVAEGSASMSGSWSTEGVDAGVHQVLVSDHRGNAFARSVVDVTSRMTPVAVTIDAIAVQGTVTHRDEPVAARLKLRHRTGSEVELRADAEGRFAGSLPAEGKWDVDITALGMRLRRSVDVRRRDTGPTEVEIALPDTRVDVTVVDASGKPVTALVRAFDAEQRPASSGSTDADGRFALVALAPGEVQVSARTRSGTESAPVMVQVSEDATAKVTLVVQPRPTFNGRIVTPTGAPVAGAFVRWTLPHRGRFYDEEVSGPNGQFRITLPPDTAKLDLVILPPAMPVKLLSIPLRADDDANLDIVVGGPAGSLEIEMHASPPFPVIQRGTVAVHTSMLQYPLNWTSPPRDMRSWGMALTLEAGAYAVCPSDGSGCKPVNLAPGAVERVDVRGAAR